MAKYYDVVYDQQGIDHLFRPEFRDAQVDMIDRYNQRHAALATSDFTAYAYAMMTPADDCHGGDAPTHARGKGGVRSNVHVCGC